MKSVIETKDDKSFLDKRKLGLGSTDSQHLFEVGKYGCRRYLEIEKSGLWDLPQRDGKFLERGKFFEPIVAALIEKEMGETLHEVGSAYFHDAPFIRGNADRVSQHAVIEIKTANSHVFRDVKKNGPPENYVYQIRWLMNLYNKPIGLLWFYWPDGHELISFKIDRNQEWDKEAMHKARNVWQVIMAMRSEGQAIAMELLAPIKDVDFPGCASCNAKHLCHGDKKVGQKEVQLNQEVTEKLEKYLELQPEYDELDKLVTQLKDEIKDFMMASGGSKASWKGNSISVYSQSRESLDPKVKLELTDEQKAKYIKKIEYPTMRITKGTK